jgi:hypothetical protein
MSPVLRGILLEPSSARRDRCDVRSVIVDRRALLGSRCSDPQISRQRFAGVRHSYVATANYYRAARDYDLVKNIVSPVAMARGALLHVVIASSKAIIMHAIARRH